MRDGAKIAIAAVAAPVLGIGAWFGFTQFQRATADYRGETAQIERTEANAAFRMQAYDGFFDRCAAVQTHEARITSLEGELATNPSAARVEQINASLSAIRTARAEQINRYNADAAKDWTRGQFQANSLPYQLDPNQESTTCAL